MPEKLARAAQLLYRPVLVSNCSAGILFKVRFKQSLGLDRTMDDRKALFDMSVVWRAIVRVGGAHLVHLHRAGGGG